MESKKTPVGRPKHVAQYATGKDAQNNFAQAMKAILSPKKAEKKPRAAAAGR